MDPLSQGVLGASASQSFASNPGKQRLALLVGLLAGMAPERRRSDLMHVLRRSVELAAKTGRSENPRECPLCNETGINIPQPCCDRVCRLGCD